MLYLLWSLPALAVVLLIASGRVSVLKAAVAGTVLALAVAAVAAPQPFDAAAARVALSRGAWIGWTVIPYILGGLLFWQVAMLPGKGALPPGHQPHDAVARRRQLFTACFLIGPFAEATTGFGIGIIGTMAAIRPLHVRPIELLAFSLLSQTMILWGAMGSGVIVGAAFAGMDPTELALRASVFVCAFHLFWLPMFWRLAARAGIAAGPREHGMEALWLAAGLALASGATLWLGPEIAMLAAYGLLIVLRFLAQERPGRAALIRACGRMLPFMLLIGGLVLTRILPPLRQWLEAGLRIVPFEGVPAWSPLYHAGTWLILGAVLTGLLRGQGTALPREMKTAWKTGRLAVLTIVIYSMMAEVLTKSGIAAALAEGLFAALGGWAILVTPVLAGLFGGLTNSGNASNGLFMASQIRLGTAAGFHLGSVAALQHISGLTMSMFSPVRMAIVCGLAGTPGRERDAYRVMLPFAAAALLVLLAGAVLIGAGVL